MIIVFSGFTYLNPYAQADIESHLLTKVERSDVRKRINELIVLCAIIMKWLMVLSIITLIFYLLSTVVDMLFIIIFLNLAFLINYSIMDIKTHTITMLATFVYTIDSLLLTNWTFFIQALIMGILMYLMSRNITISTGDRKLIFALTLQLGGFFTVVLLGFSTLVLYLRKSFVTSAPTPLIPVFLIAYVIYIAYLAATGNLA